MREPGLGRGRTDGVVSEANTFLDSADRYETVLVSRGGLFRSDFQVRQAQCVAIPAL
jgi:hypothetical protein